MTSWTSVDTSVRPPLHVCQCDQYHASLQHTSLILDIHLLINWHLSEQGIHWPVSHDHIAGSSLRSPRSAVFFFKLTADQVLVFDGNAGSTQVNSPGHKWGFIFRALSVARRSYTAILYINESSYTVNDFRVQVENSLDDVFFLHGFNDICGPHWWLRSYSSQASEGYKLKAECLFLICLELLFFFVLQFLAYL